MANFKMISADSHIVEPPDMYADRIDPKLRDRAPRMERRKTPAGREYDAWMLDGQQVGTLGAVSTAWMSSGVTRTISSVRRSRLFRVLKNSPRIGMSPRIGIFVRLRLVSLSISPAMARY